ncbi:alpha/beta hydrolase [Flammeovirga pectinis]|uniref:Alpha/beta hydrolase n=1 Tax=Flammeovirga pectinis TaxID=2494373 RepID=A0A3Q9FP77_9BACT|nr:alpha/beta hydrolase [Flammeovirga pectinis]AZQ62770.1 alpha/beta hydrolase [Flammeovirga pectinis]
MNASIKKIIYGLLSIVLIIYISVSCFGYKQIVLINTHQGKSGLEREMKRNTFDTQLLSECKQENFKVHSLFGYDLKGTYIQAPTDSLGLTVVMVHGIKSDRWTMMRYAQIYLKHGIDVVLYDQRKHGLSGGSQESYGFYESQDLEQIVQWTKKKKPKDIIAAHGESLGAATVCMHSGINESTHSVSFYISDCAYSDTPKLLTRRAKKDFGVPDLGFITTTSFLTKISAGFYFSDVMPIESVGISKVPILFIHGEKDTYIPKEMSIEMYNAKLNGEKYLWLVPNAVHANSITVAPKVYETKVMSYVNTIVSQLAE